MPSDKQHGLGRGLDSLIPTELVEEEFDVTATVDNQGHRKQSETVDQVDPALVMPNPSQPRQMFDDEALEELAASIREHGILQPLVVTKTAQGYELIAGERRLRAAKLAELKAVPVIVRSFSEQQKLELALIENLQRQNLNPIETATAYRKLIDQFNLSMEQIAKRVGKDRSTVANIIRLLGLPLEAKRALADGRISEGHARAILALPDPARRLELLEIILKRGWTVRQAEVFAKGYKDASASREESLKRADTSNPMTEELAGYLGTKVSVMSTAKGGKLIIEYTSPEQLDQIYRTIKKKPLA